MENVTHNKLVLKPLALSSLYFPPKKSYFICCKTNPTTNLLQNFVVLFVALKEHDKVLGFLNFLCHSKILLNGHPTRFGKACMYWKDSKNFGIGYGDCCLSSRVSQSKWDYY
jgi:hypothetical protein